MPIDLSNVRVTPVSTCEAYLRVQTQRAGLIKGESPTGEHADEIELNGWTWGLSANTAMGGTESLGRQVYRHLVVTKAIDCASTSLMSALANNDAVKEAKLSMRKGGGEALDYFEMKLTDARVVSLEIEVGADGKPVERVAFAFRAIEVEYRAQLGSGLGSGKLTFSGEVLPT